MNRSESEDGRHEIVIVRRGGHDDHDDHHGGVWKIAFADFMTAMMCFFLVMWLINAANEQTKVALASYFNPIKLIDRNANRKGIDDIGQGPQTSASSDTDANTDKPNAARRALSGPTKAENASATAEVEQHSDENLFADPYAVLAEIAADTGTRQNISEKGDGGAQNAGPANGASGGESYRDPFAPDFWSTQVEQTTAEETAQDNVPEGKVTVDEPVTDERFAQSMSPLAPDDVSDQKSKDEFAQAFSPVAEPPAEAAEEPQQLAAAEVPAAGGAEEKVVPPAEAAEDAAAAKVERLADDIRDQLADAFGGVANLQGITVEQSDAGVMISIADEMKDGMFEIGSAVPRRELVLAMEKIGRMLAEHDGKVTINGHTDARPFTGGKYDNWRLSTARAQAAYYMLVRGGLDEKRVSSVAGFADRRLKEPGDPYAAVNRRIEILLAAPG